MSILFKDYLKSFVKALFYSIFLALAIAGTAWLVSQMFNFWISFWAIARISYILLVIINAGGKICALFSLWVTLQKTIKRFGVSKKDASEGLFIYGLHHSRLYDEWTGDDFISSLATSRAVAEILSDV